MLPCFSNGIPQPVSVIENCAMPFSFCSSSRVILPSFVNLVALTKILISTWCNRSVSVSISKRGSSVLKKISACVCLMSSRVWMMPSHKSTALHCLRLNFMFVTSRQEMSTTSFTRFNNRREFSWIMSLHCFRVSSSIPGVVSTSEKPDKAFSGVRISWLIFDMNRLLLRIEFSTAFSAFCNFRFESINFFACLFK